MPQDVPQWLIWVPVGAAVVAGLNFLVNARYDRLAWLWPPNWLRVRPDVVVGVVRKGDDVLLVHRKPARGNPLHWQFPSGQIGAESDLKQRVEREIEQETGVAAAVTAEIGRRRHPRTGRVCVYFLAQYRSGEPVNRQPHENIYVAWVPKAEVEYYLGDGLFPKARNSLNI